MLSPSIMLILLTLIWGLTFPATKAALTATTPMQFLALRFGIAMVIILPMTLIKARRGELRRAEGESKVWIWGIGIGVLLLAGYILQAVGMKYTTASRSGFFTGLLTIFTPIFASLFRTSKTSWATWMGVPVAIVGVYLLADPSLGGMNLGDWLTVICAVVFALQMVTLEASSGKLGGIEAVAGRLWVAQIAVAGIGSVIGALIEGAEWHVAPVGWWGIAYTAIFGSIIATWAQTRYQPKVPAGHAALIFSLEPVFAAMFAAMLLGDTWTQRGLLGAGFIIMAMITSSLGSRKK